MTPSSLIDYEEDVNVPSTTNGAAATADGGAAAGDAEAKDSKKVSISFDWV